MVDNIYTLCYCRYIFKTIIQGENINEGSQFVYR